MSYAFNPHRAKHEVCVRRDEITEIMQIQLLYIRKCTSKYIWRTDILILTLCYHLRLQRMDTDCVISGH